MAPRSRRLWAFVTVTGTARLGRVSRVLSSRHLSVHAEKATTLPLGRRVVIIAAMIGTALISFYVLDQGGAGRVMVTGIAALCVAAGIHAAYAGQAEELERIAATQVGHDVDAATRMMPGRYYASEWSAILHRMGIGQEVRAKHFAKHADGDLTVRFWVQVGLSPETIQKRVESIQQAWNVNRAEPAVRDVGSGLIAVRFSNLPAPETPTYAKTEEQFQTTTAAPNLFDLTTKEEENE